MACCLFSSLVILPTLLVWLTCRRKAQRFAAEGYPPVRRREAEFTGPTGPQQRIDTAHDHPADGARPSPGCAVPRGTSYQRIRVSDE